MNRHPHFIQKGVQNILIRFTTALTTILYAGLFSQTEAAQRQLGLQTAINVPFFSSSTTVLAGPHLSGIWNVSETLKFRPVLEGNFSPRFAPSVRLDLDLLKGNGATYYGAGIGSGLIFDMTDGGSGLPNLVLSPVSLLNGHAFYGKTFNSTYVEGIVRVGPTSSVGVRFGMRFP